MRHASITFGSVLVLGLAGCQTAAAPSDGPSVAHGDARVDSLRSSTFEGVACLGTVPRDCACAVDKMPTCTDANTACHGETMCWCGDDGSWQRGRCEWIPTGVGRHLGERCSRQDQNACGGGTGDYMGIFCLPLDENGDGYCTAYCDQGDNTPCQDGFPASEGLAACTWPVTNNGLVVGYACGVMCGDEWTMDLGPNCLAGLTCQDRYTCSGNPDSCVAGSNGKNDFCWPAAALPDGGTPDGGTPDGA